MSSKSEVYIAGVGFSPGSSSKKNLTSLVSAATKALLDAGITYDDVTQGVSSNEGFEAFKAFDEGGVTVDKVESGSELDKSFRLVSDGGAQCVLMIAAERSGTVAVVLVSTDFLWRHSYLKDEAACIRGSKGSQSRSQTSLQDVCQIVWALRGWSKPKGSAGKEGRLNYHGYELSRADEKEIPKWKEIEYKQDGKHRVGHNPAAETKDISQEDFDAVKAYGQKQSSLRFDRAGGDRAALERAKL